jgi:hypothetical protein
MNLGKILLKKRLIYATLLLITASSLQTNILGSEIDNYKRKQEQIEHVRKLRLERAKEHPYLKYLTPTEASILFRNGRLSLIDVNDQPTFKHTHILGAINIPHISRTALKIRKDTPIGVYCK